MAAKCHFAHGKEDLRNIHDQLPAHTPYITDPKLNNVLPQNKQNKTHSGNGTINILGQSGPQKMDVESFQMMLMQDTNVQNQVTMQQLNYILQNLETLHQNNTYVCNKVNVAKELLCVSNLNTVAELIQGILRLPDVSSDIKMKHQHIIKEAQELSSLIYTKLATEAYENAVKQQQSMNINPLQQNNNLMNNNGGVNMNGIKKKHLID